MNKKAILTMVFLTVLVFLFPGFVHGAIPGSEREALIALYNSTNGDGWTNNSGWKTPPLHTDGFAMPGTEGSWKGVTVSGDHVIEIFIEENKLSGSLPAELGNFSNLKNLCLDFNLLCQALARHLFLPPGVAWSSSNSNFSFFENEIVRGRAQRPRECPYILRTRDNSQMSPAHRRGNSSWLPHI